jgi:hypothetical protein
MSSMLGPTFSSIRFSISGFILRCLTYLSFVQGDKCGSIFILLHTDYQLDHTIYWICFCFSLFGFGFIIKYQVSISVWVYFWFFNSIPLINLSVSVPIPCGLYHYCFVVQLEVRSGDFPGSSFIVGNFFVYSGFLSVHMNLTIAFFI